MIKKDNIQGLSHVVSKNKRYTPAKSLCYGGHGSGDLYY
jgi:hypothetical protein